MGFYDLSKEERKLLVDEINQQIEKAILEKQIASIIPYFSDEDTYIRKTAYLAISKLETKNSNYKTGIIALLEKLSQHKDEKIRQTSINAAGEIGIRDFKSVEAFFDNGLFDNHSTVRNAVIGSIKKMGEKNTKPILKWAKKWIHHEDKEIRREICHGIELRGRTHPQDILPLLQELEFDKTARVRNTLIHVLGQIAYKKGC